MHHTLSQILSDRVRVGGFVAEGIAQSIYSPKPGLGGRNNDSRKITNPHIITVDLFLVDSVDACVEVMQYFCVRDHGPAQMIDAFVEVYQLGVHPHCVFHEQEVHPHQADDDNNKKKAAHCTFVGNQRDLIYCSTAVLIKN